MTNPTRFSQVTKALAACIEAAPEAERAALAAALEGFAATYHQSYKNMTSAKAAPALARLVVAIEDASEARIDLG